MFRRTEVRHAEEEMGAGPPVVHGERLPRIRDAVGQAPVLAGGERQTVKLIGLRRTVHAGSRSGQRPRSDIGRSIQCWAHPLKAQSASTGLTRKPVGASPRRDLSHIVW